MSTFTEILNTNTYEMAQTSKINQIEFRPDSTAATFGVDKYEIAVEDEPLPEPARYAYISSFIPFSLPKDDETNPASLYQRYEDLLQRLTINADQ